MRNVLKAETLERKFPLLCVENGCIVSKDADLTVVFEVEHRSIPAVPYWEPQSRAGSGIHVRLCCNPGYPRMRERAVVRIG